MISWQDLSTSATLWLRARSRGQRWTLVVIAVLVPLLLLAGNSGLWPAAKTDLFNARQLTIDEIGAIQVAFGKSGLNDYEIRGTSILIPMAERARYLKSLADHDAVPQDIADQSGSESGLNFLQSRSQQRQATLERKKRTIRDMVQQLGFVQRAIVDFDEARGTTPFADAQRTAIVSIRPIDSLILDAANVRAVRDTVCGAVAGLDSGDVTVIDFNANRSWVGDADPVRSSLQPHAVTRLQEERQYESKIRHALSAYPGVRVNVEVAVDPVLRRIRDERTIDPNAIPLTHTVQSETSQRASGGVGERRFRDQLVGANGQARIDDASPELITRFEKEVTESSCGGTFESVETAGLTVTGVSVSVGIPERCIDYLVQRQALLMAPPESSPDNSRKQREQIAQQVFEQIRDDIRQKVQPLIPVAGSGQDRIAQVVVTIDPEISLASTAAAPAPPHASSPFWTGWHSAALVGISLAAFVWLFGRGVSKPASRAGRAMSGRGRDVPAAGSLAQLEMRQQLDQWCRDNPDAAATTIRQWLDRRAG